MKSSYVKNESLSHSSLLAVGKPRILNEDNGGERGLHSKAAEEVIEDVVIESEEVIVGAGERSCSGSSSSGTYFTATGSDTPPSPP